MMGDKKSRKRIVQKAVGGQDSVFKTKMAVISKLTSGRGLEGSEASLADVWGRMSQTEGRAHTQALSQEWPGLCGGPRSGAQQETGSERMEVAAGGPAGHCEDFGFSPA